MNYEITVTIPKSHYNKILSYSAINDFINKINEVLKEGHTISIPYPKGFKP